MAENKLKTALREVVSAEFAEIPRNEREINHSFSDDFLRRFLLHIHPEVPLDGNTL